MPFRLNPITGNLDLVNATGSGTGGVTRVGTTEDSHIAVWTGNSSDTIMNTKALVQSGGAIEAQGFITNQLITGEVHIGSNQCMITSGFSIELTGELVIEADGELIVV